METETFSSRWFKVKLIFHMKIYIVELFRSSLTLPFQGPLMKNEQDSKRAVALEMCKLLHQSRELDDNYQPIGKEDGEEEADDDDEDSSEEYGDEDVSEQVICQFFEILLFKNSSKSIKIFQFLKTLNIFQLRPGSTKRKQHYVKSIAHLLKAPPSLSQSNHLYVFHMTLTGPITDEQNTRGRPINAPEDTSKNLGFISFNRLPLVSIFCFSISLNKLYFCTLVSSSIRF